MSWKKAFPEPIVLKGNRKIATLSEAGNFILGLSETLQANPKWSYATELLLKAAATGKKIDVTDAMHQVWRAAKADGFMVR
jgi:hypothetical protein